MRASKVEDARVIATLASAFAEYLRSLGDPHPGQITEQQYVADAFGPRRAFSGLIGELDGSPVGYLLYCHGYDLDLGGRVVWVIDLFVQESARGRGVGRALMSAVGEICRDAGGKHLSWSVYRDNRIGRRFYERIGAKYSQDLDFMHLQVSEA